MRLSSAPTSCLLLPLLFARCLACFLAATRGPWQSAAASWQTWHRWHTGNARATAKLTSHLRPGAFAAADLLDHCTHLAELLQQLIDLLDCGATSTRDTLASAPVDNLGVAPLFPGHREDHGFDIFELIALQRLFHFGHRGQFIHARQHLHD